MSERMWPLTDTRLDVDSAQETTTVSHRIQVGDKRRFTIIVRQRDVGVINRDGDALLALNRVLAVLYSSVIHHLEEAIQMDMLPFAYEDTRIILSSQETSNPDDKVTTTVTLRLTQPKGSTPHPSQRRRNNGQILDRLRIMVSDALDGTFDMPPAARTGVLHVHYVPLQPRQYHIRPSDDDI